MLDAFCRFIIALTVVETSITASLFLTWKFYHIGAKAPILALPDTISPAVGAVLENAPAIYSDAKFGVHIRKTSYNMMGGDILNLAKLSSERAGRYFIAKRAGPSKLALILACAAFISLAAISLGALYYILRRAGKVRLARVELDLESTAEVTLRPRLHPRDLAETADHWESFADFFVTTVTEERKYELVGWKRAASPKVTFTPTEPEAHLKRRKFFILPDGDIILDSELKLALLNDSDESDSIEANAPVRIVEIIDGIPSEQSVLEAGTLETSDSDSDSDGDEPGLVEDSEDEGCLSDFPEPLSPIRELEDLENSGSPFVFDTKISSQLPNDEIDLNSQKPPSSMAENEPLAPISENGNEAPGSIFENATEPHSLTEREAHLDFEGGSSSFNLASITEQEISVLPVSTSSPEEESSSDSPDENTDKQPSSGTESYDHEDSQCKLLPPLSFSEHEDESSSVYSTSAIAEEFHPQIRVASNECESSSIYSTSAVIEEALELQDPISSNEEESSSVYSTSAIVGECFELQNEDGSSSVYSTSAIMEEPQTYGSQREGSSSVYSDYEVEEAEAFIEGPSFTGLPAKRDESHSTDEDWEAPSQIADYDEELSIELCNEMIAEYLAKDSTKPNYYCEAEAEESSNSSKVDLSSFYPCESMDIAISHISEVSEREEYTQDQLYSKAWTGQVRDAYHRFSASAAEWVHRRGTVIDKGICNEDSSCQIDEAAKKVSDQRSTEHSDFKTTQEEEQGQDQRHRWSEFTCRTRNKLHLWSTSASEFFHHPRSSKGFDDDEGGTNMEGSEEHPEEDTQSDHRWKEVRKKARDNLHRLSASAADWVHRHRHSNEGFVDEGAKEEECSVEHPEEESDTQSNHRWKEVRDHAYNKWHRLSASAADWIHSSRHSTNIDAGVDTRDLEGSVQPPEEDAQTEHRWKEVRDRACNKWHRFSASAADWVHRPRQTLDDIADEDATNREISTEPPEEESDTQSKLRWQEFKDRARNKFHRLSASAADWVHHPRHSTDGIANEGVEERECTVESRQALDDRQSEDRWKEVKYRAHDKWDRLSASAVDWVHHKRGAREEHTNEGTNDADSFNESQEDSTQPPSNRWRAFTSRTRNQFHHLSASVYNRLHGKNGTMDSDAVSEESSDRIDEVHYATRRQRHQWTSSVAEWFTGTRRGVVPESQGTNHIA